MTRWKEYSWPRERLSEALLQLARSADLMPQGSADVATTRLPEPPPPGGEGDELSPWFESACARLGLEVQSVKAPYLEVEHLVRRTAPALIRFQSGDAQGRFLLLVRATRGHAHVLPPSGLRARVALTELTRELRAPLEHGLEEEVESLLGAARVAPRRQRRAREHLIAERASGWEIGGVWQLGLATERNFFSDLHRAGVTRSVSALIVVQLVASLIFLMSWAMIGRGALSGHFAPGWMIAWCLTLASWVPLRILASALMSRLSVDLGARLKRRLFAGGLRLRLEEIRHMGLGQLLGRVLESEAVETQALSAVFLSIAACIDLVLAVGVLALGSGGALSAALLVAWIVTTAALGWRFYRRSRDWTDARLSVTHDLVERMVGHRTRLAQEAPERWHAGEDEGLDHYARSTRALDRSSILLHASIPGLWLLLGLAGIAPSFLTGTAAPAAIAVSLGGVLLAWSAFSRISASFGQLAEFAVAWRQVAPLFNAASRAVPAGRLLPTHEPAREPANGRGAGEVFLRGRNLVLRHPGRGAPVLQGVNFDLREGSHVLLEGPSGCGKSTLASLLFGLREPDSGLLLLDGLDRASWGADAWRKAITAAPQFHENHIFTGTLSFNLFLGSDDSDAPERRREAEELCRELNLGELLERMPAGLLQGVGETGWQLSHGERSRVFLARALLQRARLCILDESLAALDPDNLQRAVNCLQRRARSSLVIAHP